MPYRMSEMETQLPNPMTKPRPITMRPMFQTLLIFPLSNRMEKTMLAKVGMKMRPMSNAESMEKVLVQASGVNNFPSAACMAKTGRKLTMVVNSAVTTAEATSDAPS